MGTLIQRSCSAKLQIATYFKEIGLERLVPILEKEGYKTMDDIKCNEDKKEEEWNEILEIVENGLKALEEDGGDEKDADNEEIDGKALLEQWSTKKIKLSKYWEAMEEDGFDDPTQWKDLTDDELKELKFKKGEIKLFKKELKKWSSQTSKTYLKKKEHNNLKKACCDPKSWLPHQKSLEGIVRESLLTSSPKL